LFKRINQSTRLATWIESLSGTMAKRRGLPTMIGVGLIIISFAIRLVDIYVGSQLLELLWVITHHLGIIIAFIGLLLVQPLGN
jgi:hypothetical protein